MIEKEIDLRRLAFIEEKDINLEDLFDTIYKNNQSFQFNETLDYKSYKDFYYVFENKMDYILSMASKGKGFFYFNNIPEQYKGIDSPKMFKFSNFYTFKEDIDLGILAIKDLTNRKRNFWNKVGTGITCIFSRKISSILNVLKYKEDLLKTPAEIPNDIFIKKIDSLDLDNFSKYMADSTNIIVDDKCFNYGYIL